MGACDENTVMRYRKIDKTIDSQLSEDLYLTNSENNESPKLRKKGNIIMAVVVVKFFFFFLENILELEIFLHFSVNALEQTTFCEFFSYPPHLIIFKLTFSS